MSGAAWCSTKSPRSPGSFYFAALTFLGYCPGPHCPRWPPPCPHSRQQEKGRGENERLRSISFFILLLLFSEFKQAFSHDHGFCGSGIGIEHSRDGLSLLRGILDLSFGGVKARVT